MADGYYDTDFSGGAETPVSEGGEWTLTGLETGLDWTSVRVNGSAVAYGNQDGSGGFDDSIAFLGGTWDNDQDLVGLVHNTSSEDGTYREVELLLRGNLSGHVGKFYEVNFSCRASVPYCQIVRWKGTLGDYAILNGDNSTTVVDGDKVRATIVGTVITAYKWNGSSWDTLLTYDTSTGGDGAGGGPDGEQYASGQPGMGMYVDGSASTADHGFSHYTAINYGATPPSASVALTGTATAGIDETDIVAGGKTIILTLTDETWIA